MAKFGFMSKALAGAGQGLQLAGQLGFHAKLQGDLEAQRAELLAKRDEVLQRYEGGRLDKDIAARASEGALDRATRKEGFMTQKAAHLEGIDKQLQAKDNKPIALPKGAKLIAADGTVLASNLDGDDAKPITVPEGAAVVDQSGKQLYKNPKDPKAEGLPKLDTDIDKRVKQAVDYGVILLGGKLDALGKYSIPKDQEEAFAWFGKRVRELVADSNIDSERAADQAFEELSRRRNVSKKQGTSGTNPKVQELRNRFQYGQP